MAAQLPIMFISCSSSNYGNGRLRRERAVSMYVRGAWCHVCGTHKNMTVVLMGLKMDGSWQSGFYVSNSTYIHYLPN